MIGRKQATRRDEVAMLLELYRPVFDEEYYLRANPDVSESELSALEHFVRQGELEGRAPSPYFHTSWYAMQQAAAGKPVRRPVHHFLVESSTSRPHPLVDLTFVAESRGRADMTRADLLAALVSGWIAEGVPWYSESGYVDANPDVRGASDPTAHFLAAGLLERRQPSLGYHILTADEHRSGPRAAFDVIDEFAWDGTTYLVAAAPVRGEILAQVEWAGTIDPAVLAPGQAVLPHLPAYVATDLLSRDLVDYRALLDRVSGGVDVLILAPSIGLGGGEKYLSMVAAAARSRGRRVTIMTTESTDAANQEHLHWSHRRELLSFVDVVSLHDYVARTWKGDLVLALLIGALRPQLVLAANSELAFTTMAKYGTALSQITTLAAAFFSESPAAVGAPYSARYLSRASQVCHLVSDNAAFFEQTATRLPTHSSERRHVIPAPVMATSASRRESEARRRGSRLRRHERRDLNLLWVSRWEPFKDVDVVTDLARENPWVTVSAYGPGLPEEGFPDLPNLRSCGVLYEAAALDMAPFDAFLFTSRFEGMPNVVLEMVERGLPVVTPAVGGLRETFGPDSLWWYRHGQPGDATGSIVQVLRDFAGASLDDIERRTHAARRELAARHGWTGFVASVDALALVGEAG